MSDTPLNDQRPQTMTKFKCAKRPAIGGRDVSVAPQHLRQPRANDLLRLIAIGVVMLGALGVRHGRADVTFPVPTDVDSGVTIKISSPLTSVPHFGFLPLRISVENLTMREGTWRFRFEAGALRLFPGVASSTFELTAPATQTREMWCFVPLVGPGVTVNTAALMTPATAAATRGTTTTPGVRINPTMIALTNARQELLKAAFITPSDRLATSEQTKPGAQPGTQDVTVTLKQTGPAVSLPQPPVASWPPGFIAVNVESNALNPGTVTREFIYVETVSTAPPSTPARTMKRAPNPFSASGMMANPNQLAVVATGPGVARDGRTGFPNALNASAMGPLATTPELEQIVRGKFSGSGSRGLPYVIGIEPAQVPADWRMWSSFNRVLLSADDFAALDGARRGALLTWVATGGVLLLSPKSAGDSRTERVGAGRIETLPEPLAAVEPTEIFARLQLASFSPGLPDRDRVSFAPASPLGELVKFTPAETLWISLFLVLFAALIGPVNLFWLAPAQRRHRLFLTTPLISLGGAAAVAAAIVLQDGVGGEGLRRALVVLVPGENVAAVFQEQGARTGLLAAREFPLADDVLCAALPVDGSVHTPATANRYFTRESGEAGGDWFGNRSRQAHLLRRVTPTRARIEIVDTAADGTPSVQSTLATELRDFQLRDADGRTWSAASLPTGQRVRLRRVEGAATAELESNSNGTPHFHGLVKEAVSLTNPWQWVARGGSTELAPIATLQSIRWKDDAIIYAGVAERAGVSNRSAAAAGKGGS